MDGFGDVTTPVVAKTVCVKVPIGTCVMFRRHIYEDLEENDTSYACDNDYCSKYSRRKRLRSEKW